MNCRRIGVTIGVLVWAVTDFAWSAPAAPALYAKYCSVCHGDKGDGRSRARGSMIPPPRDFTSPESAQELSRERMILAVTDGRSGTAMAAWKNQLDGNQIAEIVDYIRIAFMRPIANSSEMGRRLYAGNCSVCHGDDGRGARWTLSNLKPPPRNFRLPGTAQALSRDYMVQIANHGKADTAMPGFRSQLSSEEISAVVDFIRAAFMAVPMQQAATETAGTSFDMDALLPHGLTGDSTRGQAYYVQNCSACHGIEGDGRGPRAYFILPKPRNFTHPASTHSLNRPRLYTAIAKGSRGTDMPAWEKVLPQQVIADLAEYLFQTFIAPRTAAGQASHSADKG
ncbi:MAG: c-type cytochrome [Gammaproteobacteria bacterium]|nr:c-type cytochrome [Gammaproteobacteria bacterium]